MTFDPTDRRTALGFGIFLVSLAILLVELLLTRIFSVVMFHHFSFLAVSLAMLGLGLGGLLVNLLPKAFRSDNVQKLAPYLAVAFAATLLLAANISFNTPIRLEATADNWRRVITIFAVTACPLTLGGLIVAHIFAFNSDDANRLYFFDLLGAGAACLIMAPLVGRLGAPNALLVAAAIACAAGFALARTNAARGLTAASVVALLAAAYVNVGSQFFDLKYAKGNAVGPTITTRWNSFSRVEVRGNAELMRQERVPLSWGFSSRLRTQVHELHLLYDADAMTQIVGFDGNLKTVEYLLWDVATAAHHIRKHPSVLVIGPGGGRDVLAALARGSDKVTGVEINDVTVGLMRDEFREYTSGLYDGYPGVDIVVEDGRSFVRRSVERYDLVVASLVDSWAASAAGAYALAENSLYTVEAFHDYLDALTPTGMVSFSRWYASPPDEVLRLVMLAKAALLERGISNPADHIAVVRTDSQYTRRPSLATILVKKTPFEPGEINALASWAREMLFAISYAPGVDTESATQTAFEAILGSDDEASAYIAAASSDLRPTTDDRPFFFDRLPMTSWIANRLGFSAPAYAEQELPVGSVALLSALIASAVVAVFLTLLPLLAGRRMKTTAGAPISAASKLQWGVYFASLGLGYIIVEIVLIQRFNLYLGNPTYALAVVLFTMLASSGLGALTAQRLETGAALVRVMLAICGAIVLVALTLDQFVQLTMSGGIASRILSAMVYVAPVGCIMGMPFATGLRFAGRVSPSLVSWAWAVNGGMSVLGSVLAVLISMSIGFSACLLVAVGTYAVGSMMVVLLRSGLQTSLAKRESGRRV